MYRSNVTKAERGQQESIQSGQWSVLPRALPSATMVRLSMLNAQCSMPNGALVRTEPCVIKRSIGHWALSIGHYPLDASIPSSRANFRQVASASK